MATPVPAMPAVPADAEADAEAGAEEVPVKVLEDARQRKTSSSWFQRCGGFHGHGESPKWLIYFMENPIVRNG